MAKSNVLRVVHEDAGMATAEYAVATVAATGFAGLLFKILTSETVQSLILNLLNKALEWIFG